MCNPVASAAEMMGDILYFYQAIQQEDDYEFVDAVVKEIMDMLSINAWSLLM